MTDDALSRRRPRARSHRRVVGHPSGGDDRRGRLAWSRSSPSSARCGCRRTPAPTSSSTTAPPPSRGRRSSATGSATTRSSILAEGDLKKLMLTGDIDRLLALETCLAGKPDASGQYAAPVCQDIADLGATRVVFGPATFINEAAARSNQAILRAGQGAQGRLVRRSSSRRSSSS